MVYCYPRTERSATPFLPGFSGLHYFLFMHGHEKCDIRHIHMTSFPHGFFSLSRPPPSFFYFLISYAPLLTMHPVEIDCSCNTCRFDYG